MKNIHPHSKQNSKQNYKNHNTRIWRHVTFRTQIKKIIQKNDQLKHESVIY